jgi:glycosyltransferase involved in cell wall biosynthesis
VAGLRERGKRLASQQHGTQEGMSPALVSCVIPAFNAEQFVAEAIESVLQQTYEPLEILVVDDGSTDRTADVVRSYGSQVTCLSQEHRGTAAAKNDGIRAARGACIAFLDADDLWHHDKLTRQMARLAQRPEVDLCYTQYRNVWIPELAEEEDQYEGHALSKPASGWSLSTLLTHREVFDRLGFFEESDAKSHLNLVWALGAAKQGAIIDVLAEVLTYRRLHHANMSRRWAIDDDFFRLLKTWRDYRKHEVGDDDARAPLG